MLGEIAALGSSLATAGQITRGLIELKSLSEVQGKTIELQQIIMQAQSQVMSAQAREAELLKRIAELEGRLDKVADWEQERQRYELKQIDNGAFAYVLRPDKQGDEPQHWLCTTCFERGVKSFLLSKGQSRTPTGGNGQQTIWGCDTCKATVSLFYNRRPDRQWPATH